MPMYTAASPGNLLPKFSDPADGGTIARRASLLQTSTGVADKDALLDVLPILEVVVASAAPTNAVAPRTTTRTKNDRDFIVAPFRRGAAATCDRAPAASCLRGGCM